MSQPFVITPEDVEPFDVPHHEETEARELINPERGSDDIVFRLTSMESGGQDYWHAHDDSEQLIFVRSGTGEIRISQPDDEDDQETHDLEPESFVYLPRNAYHQVTNTGETTLELIVIWAPPYSSLDEWDPENN
jgi:mannose-6-phosphate isomerase-like protein (cupin superfamily)